MVHLKNQHLLIGSKGNNFNLIPDNSLIILHDKIGQMNIGFMYVCKYLLFLDGIR